jgi:hypothetical protein
MQGVRRAAVHLALVALLLRAFLPAGWMPGAAGDAPLVMCSVGMAHDADSQDRGDKSPAKPDNGADGACAFAAAGVALSPPEPAVFLGPVLQIHHPRDQAVPPLPGRSYIHTRPASRAPPSLI